MVNALQMALPAEKRRAFCNLLISETTSVTRTCALFIKNCQACLFVVLGALQIQTNNIHGCMYVAIGPRFFR
jgi:hypothetical protein